VTPENGAPIKKHKTRELAFETAAHWPKNLKLKKLRKRCKKVPHAKKNVTSTGCNTEEGAGPGQVK